jgi:hypothetical protein
LDALQGDEIPFFVHSVERSADAAEFIEFLGELRKKIRMAGEHRFV